MIKILKLNVKKKYFDQILNGSKKFEYREVKPYWAQRLEGKIFDEVHILCGYPKSSDTARRIIRPYRGYEVQRIVHEHFGCEPVEIYAILVN